MGITKNRFFDEIGGNLGFGCMRLPTIKGGMIDREHMNQMVDLFMDNGFNYFDTAHGYHRGLSETAICETLVKRYPRNSFVLANKLTGQYFHSESEIRPFFEHQLNDCGVDYFDFYLMHAQDQTFLKKFEEANAYETVFDLKSEGKIKHVGISFHDRASVLEIILNKYPQLEFVQIQFNYLDYDDISIESRKVYEVCERRQKPVMVMEPVKGGSLVNIPRKAQAILDTLQKGEVEKKSNASYALRFAGSFPNICVVLSGMSTIDQVRENVRVMKSFSPLSTSELEAIDAIRTVFKSMNLVPCTACHYCTEGCPKQILIPELFSCLNAKKQFHNWNQDYYYRFILTTENGKASDCIQCGQCERVCPQHLEIRKLIAEVSAVFEKPKKKRKQKLS